MNNLEIIKTYQNILWVDKDISVIDKIFDKNVQRYSPLQSIPGTEKMKASILQWYKGFPHLKVYWDDFICEGDKVVSRWHAEGLHEGEFLEYPPSLKNVQYSGVTIYQLDQGKITHYWAYVDMGTIKKQISE